MKMPCKHFSLVAYIDEVLVQCICVYTSALSFVILMGGLNLFAAIQSVIMMKPQNMVLLA